MRKPEPRNIYQERHVGCPLPNYDLEKRIHDAYLAKKREESLLRKIKYSQRRRYFYDRYGNKRGIPPIERF